MKQVLCYPYWPDKKAETSPSDSGCDGTQQGGNTDFQLTWSASERLLLAVFLISPHISFLPVAEVTHEEPEARSGLR